MGMAFGSLLVQTAVVTKTIAKAFGWPLVGNEGMKLLYMVMTMGIHEPSLGSLLLPLHA